VVGTVTVTTVVRGEVLPLVALRVDGLVAHVTPAGKPLPEQAKVLKVPVHPAVSAKETISVAVPPAATVMLVDESDAANAGAVNVTVAVVVVGEMRMVQTLELTEVHPVQLANSEGDVGVAVRTTVLPIMYAEEQVLPQEIRLSAEVTVPVPVPDLLMVRVVGPVKVAVMDVAAVAVTVQVPVPVQLPPDQPLKIEPTAGVAVSTTEEL